MGRAVLETPLQQKQASRSFLDESKRRTNALWESITAPGGRMAYLPIIIVTILMFCGASWQLFWLNTDPARYQCYALTFWLGSSATNLLPAAQCSFLHLSVTQPAFHMLPLEYPPLTLSIFSLALLAPIPYYQLLFALWMALTAFLIYWLLLRYGPRGSGLIFAIYLLFGSWASAQIRFDLVPAALTLLCVIAMEQKQWRYAYIALAFGTLLKIYPILLLPFLFIAEQRALDVFYTPPKVMTLISLPVHLWRTLRGIHKWHWQNVLVFFAILLGVTGAFALLNFRGAVLDQLSYFALRPVQIEATGSTILWLATQFGYPAHTANTYGSLNIISGLDGIVASSGTVLFVLGFFYTLWLQWRGKVDMLQASIAILFLFIATGKVFSPQYLIWLMPLLAYCCAFDIFLFISWGALSLLTTYIFAYLYTRVADLLLLPTVPGFTLTVTIRNVFFVFTTLAFLFNWFQVRRRKPLPPRVTEENLEYLYREIEQFQAEMRLRETVAQ